MKKLVCLIVLFVGLCISFVGAQSISFVPQGDGVYGYDCVVPIDVYINTNGWEISAIDLVMESSMDYVDFVPSDFVPYFLKPIVKENGLIHVVGFTVDPSERVNGEGKMGTIYFSQRQGDVDGVVRLYFLGEGETSDTNLSIAGGVDVLKDVGQASVIFSEVLPSCITEIDTSNNDGNQHVESGITGGFADLSYEEVLENTIQSIDKMVDKEDTSSYTPQFLKQNIVRICLILIILVIILLLLKKEKNKGNKKSIK